MGGVPEPVRPEVRLVAPDPRPGGRDAHPPALPPPVAPPPHVRRPGRGLVRGLALLVAGAVGYGVAQLQQAQQVAGERRAAEGVLALRVQPRELGTEVFRDNDGEVTVRVPVRIVNAGPRSVVLRSAEVGGSGLRALPTTLGTLGPAQDVDTVLEQDVPCTSAVPDAPVLRITATTGAGERAVSEVLPPALVRSVVDAVHESCGFVPVQQALELTAAGYAARGEAVVLTLRAKNRSARELRVEVLRLAVGLRAELLGRHGRPRPLPFVVPPVAADRFEPRSYEVRLTVVPGLCRAARKAGTMLLDVTYNQDGQDVGVQLTDEIGAVSRLVRERCP